MLATVLIDCIPESTILRITCYFDVTLHCRRENVLVKLLDTI